MFAACRRWPSSPRPSSPVPSPLPSPGEEGVVSQKATLVLALSLPVREGGWGREREGWESEGPGCPQDRLRRQIHILFGRRPVRDRDPHRRLAVPGGAAEPAGAVLLDAGDDFTGPLIRGETDQDLVQHHVVEDLDAGLSSQPVGEAPRQGAAAVDEVGGALAAQRAEGGPDREAAGAAGEFGDVV